VRDIVKKRSWVRRKMMLVILITTMLLVVGCGQQDAGESNTLRVGYFPNITHAAAIVGVEQGIFQEELGSTLVQTQVFPNGSLLMDAIVTGQIDIGYAGPEPIINRYLQGADVVVLGGAASGGNVVVASRDSGVRNVAELASKVVATPALGCTHDIELRALMAEEGLHMENSGGNVAHRTQKPALMINLMEQGELDAVSVSEPWASLMEEKIGAKVIVEWDEMPWDGKLPSALLVASKQFVEEHPEIVRKLLKAHLASIEQINKNPKEAVKVVNTHISNLTKSKLSSAVIEKSLQRTRITHQVDPKVLNELVSKAAKLGFFEKTDVDGLVDTTILDEVARNK